MERTALSYWFPKLEAARIRVPRTTILTMPQPAFEEVFKAFDGIEPAGALQRFAEEIFMAAMPLGSPFFLRTDHTSGKHSWSRTCFVSSSDPRDIAGHVFAIAEYSEMAGLIGLPYETWAVRELLPVIPYGTCKHYRDMPICREFRFFVRDDVVLCRHPYWPEHALVTGGAEFCEGRSYQDLCNLTETEEDAVTELARAAGRAVGGEWSVDILETEAGWYVTDMAEADKSFHWEGCPASLEVVS
jgi:hypothetical protein